MNSKSDPDSKTLHDLYWHHGLKVEALAKKFDCSKGHIYTLFKKYNIETYNQKTERILNKKFLEKHYVQQRKSVTQISQETGYSASCVHLRINKYNLYRRSLKDSSHILTKSYLMEHYVRQKKGLKTIAEEIGFQRKSIVKEALLKHGIKVRKHTKSKKWNDKRKKRRIHHTISGSYFSSLRSGAKRRNIVFTIDINYIWDLFVEQNKVCAVSGELIQMGDKSKNIEQTASLDRIDSSKGYVKGNVHWVHKIVNKMKWDMPHEDFLSWCSKIHKNNTGGVSS